MPHRMMVTWRGLSTTVVCPDDLERDIREYLTPPLHLVAWAVLEASAPNSPQTGPVLTGLGRACTMESLHDLPDARELSPGVWGVYDTFPGEGDPVCEVRLLDHPELSHVED